LTSVGAVVDSFALVARHVHDQFASPYRISMQTRVRLIGHLGLELELAGGRWMSGDGDISDATDYRIVYIPAFDVADEIALNTLLDSCQPVVDWLRKQRNKGALLAASGTGVAILAHTGLLDDGTAAVPRSLASFFRRRFPRVRPNIRSNVVEHDDISTCSSQTGELTLITRLVEQVVSPHSARWLASLTGSDQNWQEERPESDDPLVSSAQLWLAQRYAQEFKIAELAAALSVSQATLLRHFSRSLGITPRAYANWLRVEAAKRILRNTQITVEQVAAMIGYSDVRSFRATFHKFASTSPAAYRRSVRVAD
jgi:transcriptional regulator GlxA family with amidase domain